MFGSTLPSITVMLQMKLDRIVTDPAICLSKPTIRATRITVDFVLRLIGDELTAQDIVRG